METVLSLPKDRIKVLLLEGIADSAAALFANAGYSNVERVSRALEGDVESAAA